MPDHSANATSVSWREAFRTWARIAALSFGRPAGQIAVMHRILVEEKRWIGETRFLHALNYCMLLPGPEAHELAIYIGWLMHRVRGGLLAGARAVCGRADSDIAVQGGDAGHARRLLACGYRALSVDLIPAQCGSRMNP
jgi:hypothetical protein